MLVGGKEKELNFTLEPSEETVGRVRKKTGNRVNAEWNLIKMAKRKVRDTNEGSFHVTKWWWSVLAEQSIQIFLARKRTKVFQEVHANLKTNLQFVVQLFSASTFGAI